MVVFGRMRAHASDLIRAVCWQRVRGRSVWRRDAAGLDLRQPDAMTLAATWKNQGSPVWSRPRSVQPPANHS